MPTRIDPQKVSERKLWAGAEKEKIPISVFENPDGLTPGAPLVLIIYGGDRNFTPDARTPIKTIFVQNGFLAASFVFRGHTPGTDFYKTGLWSRIEDAQAVLKVLVREYPANPIAVLAVSMGGYVSTFLPPELIRHLILVAPAAYHSDAVAKKLTFGPKETGGPFTDLIRPADSWENSDGFENIRKFRDSSLLVIGFTNDEVVSPEIPKRYYRNHPVPERRSELWMDFSHNGNFLGEKKMPLLAKYAIAHIRHFLKS